MDRKLDFKEAFSFLFQKGWFVTFCQVVGLMLLPVLLGLISIILFIMANMWTILLGIISTILTIITTFAVYYYLIGYFLTYSHDRAYNKNAIYRDITFNSFKEFFINGIKFIVMGIVQIPFTVLILPVLFIVLFVTNGDKGAAEVVKDMFMALVFGIPLTKIFAYFIKDMDVVSLFKWGEAFRYTKGVKGAFWVAFLPFLFMYSTVFVVCFVIGFILGIFFGTVPESVDTAVGYIVSIPVSIIGSIIYCNLLGQYTYNAIAKNENAEPETLPKSDNSSNSGMVLLVAVIIVALTLMILGVVAALTIPSLVNRQSKLASNTKMKKAIVNYESAAAVYMAENGTNNVYGLAKDNCRNIKNYLRAEKVEGCNITTIDGTYWQFYQNGSAKISDDRYAPKITITVGVCKDGTINCESEYPDVKDLMTH